MKVHVEVRARHDLEVNVKAEQEIEVIPHHLERQNDLLIAMLEKRGIKLEEVLRADRATARDCRRAASVVELVLRQLLQRLDETLR
jgi:uncharacterized membrane protein